MEQKMYKVARIDESKHRPLVTFDGQTIFPSVNGDGVAIYDCPMEFASHIIMSKPERYRLYDSPALACRVVDPNGAGRWENQISWAYRKVSKAVMKDGRPDVDDKGQQINKTTLEWYANTTWGKK